MVQQANGNQFYMNQILPTVEELSLDVSQVEDSLQKAVTFLQQYGVVILKNFFKPEEVDYLARETEAILKQGPALAGSFGYCKKDYPKKMLDPFVIGGAAVDLCLNERLINYVEAYMDSDAILSEAFIKFDKATPYEYFPLHADYAPDKKRSNFSDIKTTQENIRTPLGVGGVLYLRDCTAGAFCYCIESHHLLAPKGHNLTDYEVSEQRKITENKLKLTGKKGDFILFDDRGFHGPDHPSS